MSNFLIEFTFEKNLYLVDVKDEEEAKAKSKAFLLNLLNQIPDNQTLVESWMKVKIIKVGE